LSLGGIDGSARARGAAKLGTAQLQGHRIKSVIISIT